MAFSFWGLLIVTPASCASSKASSNESKLPEMDSLTLSVMSFVVSRAGLTKKR